MLASDKGQSQVRLDTGTIATRDILDHDKSISVNAQLGLTLSEKAKDGTAPKTDAQGHPVGGSVSGAYAMHDIAQVTRATIGEGTITVRNEAKQRQEVKDINRDVTQAQVITKIERAGVEFYGSSDAINEIASGFEGIQQNIRDIPNLPANIGRGIDQIISGGSLISKTLGQAADAIIDALKDKGQLSPKEVSTQKEIQDKLKDPSYLKILEGCASGTVRCEYTQAQAATGLAVYEGAGLAAGALAAAPAVLLGLALNTLFVSSSGGVLDKSATLSNGIVLSVKGGGSSGIITLSAKNPDGSQTTLVLQSTPDGYALQGGKIQVGGETWEITQRQLTAVLDAVSPALAQSGVVVVANQSGGDSKGEKTPIVGGGHSTPGMPDPDDNDPPPSFRADNNQQIGTKLRSHVKDFGGDPSNPADRQRVINIINDIGNNPDRIVRGTFSGQGPEGTRGAVFFRIKGNDVVVTKTDGSFVTVLKDGVTQNTSVIRALRGLK